MNQSQPELTLEESVKQVMRTLPPPIRDYLSRGKYTPVAKEMMVKYGLRIDQGGILERGMMLLLMGIEDPAEFSKSLIEDAKLDQQTVNSIMQDVNTQIFIPLRDEMHKELVAPKPSIVPATRAPQVSATPRVLVPAAPVRKPALRDVLASVMKAPPPAAGNRVATDTPPAQIVPSIVPIPIVAPPAPPRAAPPENLPGAPRPSHAAPIAPAPESRTEPPKPPVASAAQAKPYSVDPYRESIDERR